MFYAGHGLANTSTYDDFNTPHSQGIGADRNNIAWVLEQPPAYYAVNAGSAHFKVPSILRVLARIPINYLNAEARTIVRMDQIPSSGFMAAGLTLRNVPGSTYTAYRAELRYETHAVRLVVEATAGGTTKILDSVVINRSPAVGEKFHIVFSATGAYPTKLRAKAWSDGLTYPVSSWNIETNDSTPELQSFNGWSGLTVSPSASYSGSEDVFFESYSVSQTKMNGVSFNILNTISAETQENNTTPTELVLDTVSGTPTHIQILEAKCDVQGNEGFGYTKVRFYSELEQTLEFQSCYTRGTDNNETAGSGAGYLIEIPVGAEKIVLEAVLKQSISGSKSSVVVNLLGEP